MICPYASTCLTRGRGGAPSQWAAGEGGSYEFVLEFSCGGRPDMKVSNVRRDKVRWFAQCLVSTSAWKSCGF
jgi:hypothetical protein